MQADRSNITIRPMTEADLPAVWKLRLRALHDHPDAFGEPFDAARKRTPDQVREAWEQWWNHDDNRVFIAIDPAGTILGMTGIAREPNPKMRHRGNVWGVYVAPEARGLGISSRLLRASVDYARNDLHLLQLHLQVISTNLTAVRSYVRMGFVRYGRIPRADVLNGVEHDNDLMVLMLDGREINEHAP